jgi:hypothetical protein
MSLSLKMELIIFTWENKTTLIETLHLLERLIFKISAG